MTKRYTAADFANAKFAESEDGRRAVRLSTEQEQPWRAEALTDTEISFGVFYATDGVLARTGWVPVPTKPTLTESSIKKMVGDYAVDEFAAGFAGGFRYAGGEIIPDPEPTNTERLADGITEAIHESGRFSVDFKEVKFIAKYLDKHGVKVEDK